MKFLEKSIALLVVWAAIADALAGGLPDISKGSTRVLVVAHRANYGDAPENSLAAIRACMAGGVDMIEIDVRKTKDGRLVLMHDAKVDRTTNGEGSVEAMTWAAVRKLHLCTGDGKKQVMTNEKVPSLEEALTLCKGNIYVNLDLKKGVHLVKDCTEVIKKTGTESIIMYRSSNAEWLAHVAHHFPQMYISAHFDHRRKDSQLRGNDLEFLQPYLKAIKLWGVDIKDWNNPVLSKTNANDLKERNLRVWVYTLWGKYSDREALKNPAAVWGKLIDRGVSVVMTDEPEALIRYLESIDRH